jgi:uncharacterized membrane protein
MALAHVSPMHQPGYMQSTAPRNRVMFVVGLLMALGTAALMVWTDIEVPVLAAIGVAGIALIATSRRDRRLLR